MENCVFSNLFGPKLALQGFLCEILTFLTSSGSTSYFSTLTVLCTDPQEWHSPQFPTPLCFSHRNQSIVFHLHPGLLACVWLVYEGKKTTSNRTQHSLPVACCCTFTTCHHGHCQSWTWQRSRTVKSSWSPWVTSTTNVMCCWKKSCRVNSCL